jgi:PPM family protein phosphatase
MASLPQPSDNTLLPLAAGKTDVGRRRDHNEDQILIADELGVYAVADGMGGHQAGDVASAVTAAALEEFFWSEAGVDPSIANIEGLPEGARRLVAGVHHCNDEVFSRSGRSANQGGMGSTIVAIYVSPDEGLVHIAHVGDSRCYRVRGSEIELLTEDHSMINEALRLNPDLSEDILRQLPTNVVTRALGTKESVRPDVRSEPMCEGDVYLLCSDGLSGEMTDEEMLAVVFEAGDNLEQASELLVAMANEAGGRDNISALVVRIADARRLPAEARRGLAVVPRKGEADVAIEVEEDTPEIAEVEVSLDDGLPAEPETIDIDLDDDEAWPPDSTNPPYSDAPEGVSEPPSDEPTTSLYDEAVRLVARVHPTPPDASVAAMPVLGLGRSAPPPPEGPVRRCLSCGHGMLPEERFCGMCGTPSDDEDDDVARCDACGHEVLLGTTFCVECGVMHGF